MNIGTGKCICVNVYVERYRYTNKCRLDIDIDVHRDTCKTHTRLVGRHDVTSPKPMEIGEMVT